MYFQVIMPISADPLTTDKQNVIRSLAQEFGYSVDLPQVDSKEFDLRACVKSFSEADFIVADLSYERPSCYYELGIAEALGLQIFVIAAQATYIHQTSKHLEVKYYTSVFDYQKLIRTILLESR